MDAYDARPSPMKVDPMAPDENEPDPGTAEAPHRTVQHMKVSDVEPLRDLPDDPEDQPSAEDDEDFRPGPSFGEGM